MSEMPLLKPLIRAPITMTTVTPIATPRMVSAARILCARSDPSAISTPSSSGVTGGLLLAQGDHRVEPGCAARGVDARHDADAGAAHDPQEDRDRRHAGGERRHGVEQQGEPDARHDAERGP